MRPAIDSQEATNWAAFTASQKSMSPESPDQHLLNVLASSLVNVFAQGDFMETKRYIKQLFVVRDFKEIFTNQKIMAVYAAEYCPGRALCYMRVFVSLDPIRELLSRGGSFYCLGSGNGSELLAIAAAMHGNECQQVTVKLQDQSLYNVIPDIIAGVREGYSLDNDAMVVENLVGDLTSSEYLESQIDSIADASCVTAMFLLNEILADSKLAFVKLVTLLVKNMRKGALLLVVDSAGSFSETSIGNQRYMSHVLLDKISAFDLVSAQDSEWYRHDSGLEYPLKLQNMRYFLRLYRKN